MNAFRVALGLFVALTGFSSAVLHAQDPAISKQLDRLAGKEQTDDKIRRAAVKFLKYNKPSALETADAELNSPDQKQSPLVISDPQRKALDKAYGFYVEKITAASSATPFDAAAGQALAAAAGRLKGYIQGLEELGKLPPKSKELDAGIEKLVAAAK